MTLTARDKKIMLLIVPVLALAGLWFGLLGPKRDRAAALAEDVAAAQVDRDDAEAAARAARQTKDDYAGDYATVVRLGKATPTTIDMPSLIVQLDEAARGTKIRFSKVATSDSAGAGATPAPAPAGGSGSGTPAPAGGSGSGTPASESGGPPASTGPGQATEQANEAADASNESSSQSESSTGSAAPGGESNATPAPPSESPTPEDAASPTEGTASKAQLETVPLDFTFNGSFFELADFFHEMKRFVRVVNGRIDVRGRLMTIDSFTFKSEAERFPVITAEVKASVYLAAKDAGVTGGATPSGPAGGAPAPAASGAEPSSAPSPSEGTAQ